MAVNYNDCGTKNLIYLISCNICLARYVGETGNGLRTRVNQHKSDILHHNDTPVAHHFKLANHCLAHFRITIFQAGPISDTEVLQGIYIDATKSHVRRTSPRSRMGWMLEIWPQTSYRLLYLSPVTRVRRPGWRGRYVNSYSLNSRRSSVLEL